MNVPTLHYMDAIMYVQTWHVKMEGTSVPATMDTASWMITERVQVSLS